MLQGVDGVRIADVSFFTRKAVVVVDQATDPATLTGALRGRYGGSVTKVEHD
jgi:hypothetical protein